MPRLGSVVPADRAYREQTGQFTARAITLVNRTWRPADVPMMEVLALMQRSRRLS
jgi:hypothetical protein